MSASQAPERREPRLTVAQLLSRGWLFQRGAWVGPSGEHLDEDPPNGGWLYDEGAATFVPPRRKTPEEAGIAPLPELFRKVDGKWIELTEFICPVCSKSNPHWTSLVKHWKTHLEDRRFECECTKGFKTSTDLLSHRRRCRVALGQS